MDDLSTYYSKPLVYYILLSRRVCETGRLWRFSCSSKKCSFSSVKFTFATLKSSIGYHDHDHSAIFEKPPWTFFGAQNLSRRKPYKNICPIALEAQIPRFPWLRFNGLFHQDSSWVGPGALVKSAAQLKDLQIKALCFFETYLGLDGSNMNLWKPLGGSKLFFVYGVWWNLQCQVSSRK